MLETKFIFFLSTDWKNYAEQIEDVLRAFEDKFSIETLKQILGESFLSFKEKVSRKGERYITSN